MAGRLGASAYENDAPRSAASPHWKEVATIAGTRFRLSLLPPYVRDVFAVAYDYGIRKGQLARPRGSRIASTPCAPVHSADRGTSTDTRAAGLP